MTPTRLPNRSTTPRHSTGMSFFGWIFVLLIVGAAASLGIRLAPYYIDHSTIENVVGEYAATRDAARASNASMRQDISRRLKMNNVRGIDLREAMSVTRDREAGVNTIVFDYEVREHVAANIDVVLHFRSDIPITGRP